MVALVACMGRFDLLRFKMPRHGNGLDDRLGARLDFGIVAAQAKRGDFSVFFYRQGAHFITVPDMVGIGAVAKFARDGFMASRKMDGRFIGMAFETGGVGSMADRTPGLGVNGLGALMTMQPEGIWNQPGLYDHTQPRCRDNNCRFRN